MKLENTSKNSLTNSPHKVNDLVFYKADARYTNKSGSIGTIVKIEIAESTHNCKFHVHWANGQQFWYTDDEIKIMKFHLYEALTHAK